MEREFWENAWDENNIGFHMSETNQFLKYTIDEGIVSDIKTALIPLCGKSLDLLYLRELGVEVFGVEIATKAVEQFFEENSLDFEIEEKGNYKIYKTSGITIFCGDFFSLKKDDLPKIDFIYDRASNVALPPQMRERYYDQIRNLSSDNTQMLLLTAHSEEEDQFGPPFSIPKEEIANAYKSYAEEFRILEEQKKKITSKRLLQSGLKHRVMVAHYIRF